MQKLSKNVGDFGKLIVAKGFKNLPKVQKIAQSGHTARDGPFKKVTMKQEKIMPRGAGAEAVDKTGVHRNTKMYMQLSTMLWTRPIKKIGRLRQIINAPSRYDVINSTL